MKRYNCESDGVECWSMEESESGEYAKYEDAQKDITDLQNDLENYKDRTEIWKDVAEKLRVELEKAESRNAGLRHSLERLKEESPKPITIHPVGHFDEDLSDDQTKQGEYKSYDMVFMDQEGVHSVSDLEKIRELEGRIKLLEFQGKQATTCGKCLVYKRTPWRDDIYGYVCVTCLSNIHSEEKMKFILKIDKLLNHCDKEGGECSECAKIICPHEDTLHFHHDGCPSCTEDEDNN